MCKVKVADQQGLAPLTRNESIKLGAEAKQGIRLACQAAVRGNVVVEVPEDPLKAAVRRRLAEIGRGNDE